jgi:hypothetical protein
VISIVVLLPLYFIAIQFERGGNWRILAPFVAVALVVDVLLNYTELALLTLDFPMQGEWTFSKRLSRLQHAPGARGEFAWYIARCLDSIAPSGKHIL